ncbi:hypothetical protein BV25DRAFT_698818 [Artomyces pyxidatus]|uniref:Uncharacterized protein n=1 Tax=Artomyces pyxidatus TaxID=48021 RepID=A0ACB8T235_9AGAM|nr:hypothetical protein BV25DRAFT_698818 [Artomyces pyxidatus]
MPPGAWHEVYTPVNTIFSGGHFFTHNTLHLTQSSRAYDHQDHSAPKASLSHAGFRRILTRMVLGLQYIQQRTLKKRAFLALEAMMKAKANIELMSWSPSFSDWPEARILSRWP